MEEILTDDVSHDHKRTTKKNGAEIESMFGLLLIRDEY